MKSNLYLNILIAIFGLVLVTGCHGDPTNAPTKEDMVKADQDRAAAIDKDPSLTPEGKAKMKAALHLDSSNSYSTTGGR